MPEEDSLKVICAEGEGQKVEFKSRFSDLAKEIVAFANASGGSIFLGISDDGQITGVEDSNRLRSQIQDIANNCDPRIPIRIVPHDRVLEIIVPEGSDKPYRCNDGFSCASAPIPNSLIEMRFSVLRSRVTRFASMSNLRQKSTSKSFSTRREFETLLSGEVYRK